MDKREQPLFTDLETPPRSTATKRRRANELTGSEWTRYSISVWNDIRKSADEAKSSHPAMFPSALVERLLQCFTCRADQVVLDPFCGSGATLLGARKVGKLGIGFEVSKDYYDLALKRVREQQPSVLSERPDGPEPRLYNCDARLMAQHVEAESVDICITSPPYWDILSRKRTADYKGIRDYAGAPGDVSRVDDYGQFLDALAAVFHEVHRALRSKKYCIVDVMDIRKHDKFYPLHADLARRLTEPDVGFVLDDTIIWDRRQEYNNLRPLGYPTTFRINKIHEYLLVFAKPDATSAPGKKDAPPA
ncbi:MAG TPA: DNA methyltransferase [Bryobacterales bacterium]|nr:DNA methyltransferase [Bryobacterales bacterium]